MKSNYAVNAEDHIWGNCAFDKEMIIGREKCRMEEGWFLLNISEGNFI